MAVHAEQVADRVSARRRPRTRRTRPWYLSDDAIRVLTLAGVLAGWEILGRTLGPLYFASASRTWNALADLITSGELLEAWQNDLFIMLTGLGIAAASGVTFGFLFGRFKTPDLFFQPVLTALFMTPKIALLPIIAIWLGYQTSAKIVVVFLFSFFEVFFTVHNGVRTVDREYVTVARAYNIPERMSLVKIVFPATLPFVLTGLRLGLLHGMVGLVLVGFFLENIGIGGLISFYGSAFRIAEVFAVIISVMLVGVVMNVGLRYAERKLAPWNVRAAR